MLSIKYLVCSPSTELLKATQTLIIKQEDEFEKYLLECETLIDSTVSFTKYLHHNGVRTLFSVD